ncbi:MAG TPA: class I adenylate-forming enzyme family protein [Ideonella sp.]|nr:class I adenylate-forming enzyme family protein [Ideonella sp.]
MQRIHEAFDAWLAHDPARTFLHLKDRNVDFASLGVLVDALERELRADGVRPGDRVLIVAENCPEHVALILACSRVGAWSCGVNARMAPGEVAAFAEKADARRLYFTAAVSAAAARHAERFSATDSKVPGLAHSLVREDARAETGELAERVAAIIFTSGTTGVPKGVMVTHDGLLHFGRVSAESRQLGPEDRSYAYLPMTHIFGLGTVLMASLQAGASLVMRSQFDAADVLDALAHHQVSQLQGPPTLFSRLLAYLDERGIDHPAAPALRYVYTGAGPLDMPLKRRVEERFAQPLHHGYGLSEYAGSVHVTAIGQHRGDTSAGTRVEGAELRIVNPDGRDLPAGERGEIWLRGRGLMAGYFRDEAATGAVMRSGGWYASGDLGYLDEDGALFVVGRLKEMIIRSGFNVYPGEVEAVLHGFAAIHAAAVVGRPEGDGNEEVVAFVTLKPSCELNFALLDAHLREHLAPYKRPARIKVVDAFPMTLSGKVLKRELLASLTPS